MEVPPVGRRTADTLILSNFVEIRNSCHLFTNCSHFPGTMAVEVWPMKRLLVPIIALFLLLTTLILPAAAYEIPEDFSVLTLEDVMADFMADWGLNSENFAVSYYNTVTGESYAFNDTHMMVAASTFKLPLNLYYYDLEHAGSWIPTPILK